MLPLLVGSGPDVSFDASLLVQSLIVRYAVIFSCPWDERWAHGALQVKWDEEFAVVRKDSSELLREIRRLAAAEDWTNVMETTRMSDLSFRKK